MRGWISTAALAGAVALAAGCGADVDPGPEGRPYSGSVTVNGSEPLQISAGYPKLAIGAQLDMEVKGKDSKGTEHDIRVVVDQVKAGQTVDLTITADRLRTRFIVRRDGRLAVVSAVSGTITITSVDTRTTLGAARIDLTASSDTGGKLARVKLTFPEAPASGGS